MSEEKKKTTFIETLKKLFYLISGIATLIDAIEKIIEFLKKLS